MSNMSISLDPQKPGAKVFLGIAQDVAGGELVVLFARADGNSVNVYDLGTCFIKLTPDLNHDHAVMAAVKKIEAGTATPDFKIDPDKIMFGEQVVAAKLAEKPDQYSALCAVYGLERYRSPTRIIGVSPKGSLAGAFPAPRG